VKLDFGNRIVKQYFVEVDKDDKYKRVVWAPLLWDLTQRGYCFTGFYWNLPKFHYDGPDTGSIGLDSSDGNTAM
jgi:hypothetical protein